MPSPKIRALPTVYSGVTFRSRTEARWAVFMDALGVPWEYEKEGYALPSGNYLPDFWLPHIRSFFEVKGVDPTDHEESLASELAIATGCDVFVATGAPICPDDRTYGDSIEIHMPGSEGHPGGWDLHYQWCECPKCGAIGLEFDGRADRIKCKCNTAGDKGYNFDSPRLLAAYAKARSERFGT